MTPLARQHHAKEDELIERRLGEILVLTRQRSVDELDVAFVSVLAALVADGAHVKLHRSLGEHRPSGSEIIISSIHGGGGANRTPTRAVDVGSADAHVSQVLNGTSTVHDLSGDLQSDDRWLFPITRHGRAVAVLEFARSSIDPTLDPFVYSALDVYRNQFALLDEMQRDVLTRLLNRQSFDLRLNEILEHVRSSPQALNESQQQEPERRHFDEKHSAWLGMIDIDHFKRINDHFGHLYGDEVLVLFARLMQQNFREHDLLFRWGGEEFVVLLSPTSRENAVAAFERFRQCVRDYDFPQLGTITASIGMTEIDEKSSPTELIGNADQALYEAKRQGRDRLLQYAELVRRHQIEVPKPQSNADIDLFD